MRKKKRPKTETPALQAPMTQRGNRHGWSLAGPAVLLVAGLLAYSNTFNVPLLLDDVDRIEANPAIRTLWPVWVPMSTTNRPLGTYTFAVNYALHGYRVGGYHAANLAIHLAAGLALLGIVRRTLGHTARRAVPPRRPCAGPGDCARLAAASAADRVGNVHRAAARIADEPVLSGNPIFFHPGRAKRPARLVVRRRDWRLRLGMGTKEVMVTAPLVVLLYDRIFVAENWRAIFSARRGFYLGLAACWGVLAWSMLHWQGDYSSGLIGPTDELTPSSYLLSQAGVLTHYLRLCFWPIGQCLDQAWPVAHTAGEIVPPLVLIGGLLLATAWSLFRRPASGFSGPVFFYCSRRRPVSCRFTIWRSNTGCIWPRPP